VAGKDGNAGRDLPSAISPYNTLETIQADGIAQSARRKQLGDAQR
jgi:hypothetical protein